MTEKEKDSLNGKQTEYLTKLLKVPGTTLNCALIGGLNLSKIEHISNSRKLQYYVDLQNREEMKLQGEREKILQNQKMSYEQKIK